MFGILSLKSENRIGVVLFLFLPVCLFIVFYITPLIFTVVLSFREWDGISPTMRKVGLLNYRNILRSGDFATAAKNSAQWLVFFVIIMPALGLALSLMLNNTGKMGNAFSVLFFLPNTMTPIAVAAIWRWIFNPDYGIINIVITAIGLGALAPNWLGNVHLVTYTLMISTSWASVGIPMLLFLAGLQNVPRELIDAARIDGASPVQEFRYVTWPMITPATVIVVALSAIDAIKFFDLVFALTGGGPGNYSSVIALYMYDVTFTSFLFGRGAAAAMIMFILAGAIISPYLIYSLKRVESMRQ